MDVFRHLCKDSSFKLLETKNEMHNGCWKWWNKDQLKWCQTFSSWVRVGGWKRYRHKPDVAICPLWLPIPVHNIYLLIFEIDPKMKMGQMWVCVGGGVVSYFTIMLHFAIAFLSFRALHSPLTAYIWTYKLFKLFFAIDTGYFPYNGYVVCGKM